MKPPQAANLLFALMIAMSTAHFGDSRDAYPRPKVWPKPTPPAEASPIYHELSDPVPDEADLAREEREHPGVVERAIEASLRSADLQRREAALVFLLPQLLQVEPGRVMDLYARQPPGADRDLLRIEVARLWISQDPVAARRWFDSLDEAEQRDAVRTAVNELLPYDPAQAAQLARQFLPEDVRLSERLGDARH